MCMAMVCACFQRLFASASDVAALMSQTLQLANARSALTPESVRQSLSPVVLMDDGVEAVGSPWEMRFVNSSSVSGVVFNACGPHLNAWVGSTVGGWVDGGDWVWLCVCVSVFSSLIPLNPNCLPCLVLVLANVGGILDQKQAGVVAWIPLVCCAGAAAWLWDLHVNACLRDG